MAYVTLAAIRHQQHVWSWALALLPLALGWALHRIVHLERSWLLTAARGGLQATVFGVVMYAVTLFGPTDNAAFSAAAAVGVGSAVAGALSCIAKLESPPGLLTGHKAARSLDAFAVVVVVWSLVGFASLLRALAPELVRLDPQAVDSAYVFASLGSLLVLCASLLRTKLLRGLELGVGDRANAGLALALAGALVGAASGFIRMSTADRVATMTVVTTSALVTWTAAARNAEFVTRTVRAVLALLVLGVPVALLGAWLALNTRGHPATIVLGVAVASMLVGLVARSAGAPLGPANSRWLFAIEKAMDAALHPQPDIALRASLSALKRAERVARTRPEIFQHNPPRLLSVDVAGYLTTSEAEFPQGVFDLAAGEPGRTLRRETVLSSEVRMPSVRPVASWFRAHEAKTATALFDEDGPVGLLVLPQGRRRASLGIEEARLLGDLAERLTGVLSVTSGLARAQKRELEAKDEAERTRERIEHLERVVGGLRSGARDASHLAEAIETTGHGAAAQMARGELERAADAPILHLLGEPGVDALGWAAVWHRMREGRLPPLVVQDCSDKQARSADFWKPSCPSSPLNVVENGTLVLVATGGLTENVMPVVRAEWDQLTASQEHARLVLCSWPAATDDNRLLTHFAGESIALPALRDRAEDIQALVLFELSRIGLGLHGTPLGLSRDALELLLEREFLGNELELRALLVAASTAATPPRVEVSDLKRALATDLEPTSSSIAASVLEDESVRHTTKRRSRSKRPPRSRRS